MRSLSYWLAFVLVLSGCSCETGSGSPDSGVHADTGPRPDTGPLPDVGPRADAGSSPLGGWFRHGENAGYYGPGIDDSESAMLAAAAGCDSQRVSLPETFLAQWGAGIEESDFATYRSLGMDHLVAFLTSPTRAHSTAPGSAADWELAHYAPTNLYEPTFLPDGSVNPMNFWASYVAMVIAHYGDQIDIYEVWNEPDQVGSNWMATQHWDTTAPAPSDLIWWNASIYEYVRMLRVTHEVVQRMDPSAAVTPGGIGYPSFLSALLRYTDEPTAGAVDADHPSTAYAYMDVLSYHYYPVFAPGNSDVGADGLIAARDHYDAVFAAAGVAPLPYVVTESGAPRRMVGTVHGSPEYARNYLLKIMTRGHAEGLLGIDWFALGESGAGTTEFDAMGLYESYAAATTTSECHIDDTGVAYATLGHHLHGAHHDPSATIPAGAEGAGFVAADGSHVLVLWVRGTDESASAMVVLASDHAWTEHAWDWSRTHAETTLTPSGGSIALALTSAPVFLTAP
jgi:hypothetical protein